MKISLCQINPVIGDFAYNTSLIMKAVEESRKSGCSLAVFPELSIMGYPPKDLLEKPAFLSDNLKFLEALASSIQGIHVLCGYVDRSPGKKGKTLINSAAILRDGKIAA